MDQDSADQDSADQTRIGTKTAMGRAVGLWLLAAGLALLALGFMAWAGWLSWFGRLPGDIRIQSGRTRIYIPITSMLLISALLNLLLYVVFFLFRR